MFIIFLYAYVYMFVSMCLSVWAYTCVLACTQVQDPLICLPSNGIKDSHCAHPALMWVLGMWIWSLSFCAKCFISWAISQPLSIFITRATAQSFLPSFLLWLSSYPICEHLRHKAFMQKADYLSTLSKIIQASPSTAKSIKSFTSPNRVATLSYFAPVLSFPIKWKTSISHLSLCYVAIYSALHIPIKRANAYILGHS